MREAPATTQARGAKEGVGRGVQRARDARARGGGERAGPEARRLEAKVPRAARPGSARPGSARVRGRTNLGTHEPESVKAKEPGALGRRGARVETGSDMPVGRDPNRVTPHRKALLFLTYCSRCATQLTGTVALGNPLRPLRDETYCRPTTKPAVAPRRVSPNRGQWS
ncbi:hypothetical protein GCM10009828_065120 [Actinoplanes couchii]|uniref:Uncharacterized protein n=1 Tax=Actinoplanes couchii TaxID=403638 RepID=A0ABQ3X2X8_9ACTN|nr:hypothetical protein Aco03nite_012690 [Actinoplanes couchii]